MSSDFTTAGGVSCSRMNNAENKGANAAQKLQHHDEMGAPSLSSLSRHETCANGASSFPVDMLPSCTYVRNGVEHALHAAIVFCFFSAEDLATRGLRKLVASGSSQDMK